MPAAERMRRWREWCAQRAVDEADAKPPPKKGQIPLL
jgi:hypothetical protein